MTTVNICFIDYASDQQSEKFMSGVSECAGLIGFIQINLGRVAL